MAEYAEVCKNHSGITEFRARLLALLPLVSGSGIYLLLREKPPDPTHLPAIGLFGFIATLGLFLHEVRGMRRCWELVELGKSLEERLHLEQGQFIREYSYYHEKLRIVGTGTASWVIYSGVLLGWLYVAAASRIDLRNGAAFLAGLFSIIAGIVIWRKSLLTASWSRVRGNIVTSEIDVTGAAFRGETDIFTATAVRVSCRPGTPDQIGPPAPPLRRE